MIKTEIFRFQYHISEILLLWTLIIKSGHNPKKARLTLQKDSNHLKAFLVTASEIVTLLQIYIHRYVLVRENDHMLLKSRLKLCRLLVAVGTMFHILIAAVIHLLDATNPDAKIKSRKVNDFGAALQPCGR